MLAHELNQLKKYIYKVKSSSINELQTSKSRIFDRKQKKLGINDPMSQNNNKNDLLRIT